MYGRTSGQVHHAVWLSRWQFRFIAPRTYPGAAPHQSVDTVPCRMAGVTLLQSRPLE